MRIWQFYAVQELSKYGMPPIDIATSTGLTTVAIAQIQGGGTIASTFLLHSDGDTGLCPYCRSQVTLPCLSCYREEVGPDHLIEVVDRPLSHQNYMMNVHLYLPEELCESIV